MLRNSPCDFVTALHVKFKACAMWEDCRNFLISFFMVEILEDMKKFRNWQFSWTVSFVKLVVFFLIFFSQVVASRLIINLYSDCKITFKKEKKNSGRIWLKESFRIYLTLFQTSSSLCQHEHQYETDRKTISSFGSI